MSSHETGSVFLVVTYATGIRSIDLHPDSAKPFSMCLTLGTGVVSKVKHMPNYFSGPIVIKRKYT